MNPRAMHVSGAAMRVVVERDCDVDAYAGAPNGEVVIVGPHLETTDRTSEEWREVFSSNGSDVFEASETGWACAIVFAATCADGGIAAGRAWLARYAEDELVIDDRTDRKCNHSAGSAGQVCLACHEILGDEEPRCEKCGEAKPCHPFGGGGAAMFMLCDECRAAEQSAALEEVEVEARAEHAAREMADAPIAHAAREVVTVTKPLGGGPLDLAGVKAIAGSRAIDPITREQVAPMTIGELERAVSLLAIVVDNLAALASANRLARSSGFIRQAMASTYPAAREAALSNAERRLR